MTSDEQNQQRNKIHFEKVYSDYNIHNILHWINNLDIFLNTATLTEASWAALYQKDFRHRIKGKKVLEMGCGDCTNAAVMAALGAEVYANDIAPSSGNIVERLNKNYPFEVPITFVKGDFLKNNLSSGEFDFVIGKAFLHHLTVPVERLFLEETARLLKEDGEARFFEPTVNNKFIDAIRWYIPVRGRPSKFKKRAFRKWKENDPHPDRSYSSKHWEKVGGEIFKEVEIFQFGTLERFGRFLKWGKRQSNYKKWALKAEYYIPHFVNRNLSRSQLIIYRKPRSF